MKTKGTEQKGFWARLAQIGLGLLIIAGAVWALTQPATAFTTFLMILGLLLLVCGAAAIVAYYRSKDKPVFKDKVGLGLGVLMVIVGILMLAVPNFMSPALQWVAAVAFLLTAVRGLLAFKALRAKNHSLGTISLILNLVLPVTAILLVFNPLPALFTFPLLIFIALLCTGADLIVSAIK